MLTQLYDPFSEQPFTGDPKFRLIHIKLTMYFLICLHPEQSFRYIPVKYGSNHIDYPFPPCNWRGIFSSDSKPIIVGSYEQLIEHTGSDASLPRTGKVTKA